MTTNDYDHSIDFPDKHYFGSLRAEDEIEWVEQCFVPPPNFFQLGHSRSMVIFGAAGYGKTLLYHHFIRHQGIRLKPDRWFVVEWQLSVLKIPQEIIQAGGVPAVKFLIKQILEDSALALLDYIAAHGDMFNQLSRFNQQIATWIIRTYIQRDLQIYGNRLIARQPANEAILQQILYEPVPAVFQNEASEQDVVAELVEVVKAMGLEGVWIVVDSPENWLSFAPDTLVATLKTFLATLPLFEDPCFSYKLFVPTQLFDQLRHPSGVIRRRIDTHYLSWNVDLLQQMVEERLSLVMGQANFKLTDLCNSPKLLPWLEKVGGNSPREWLAQVKPLVLDYLHQKQQRPIHEKRWLKIRQANPPRIYIDERQKQILIGAQMISLADIPPNERKILTYLYQQENRPVSKAELYYKAYLEMADIPYKDHPSYAFPKDYEGIINNIIWRLRQVIEPDPKTPVLLLTIRSVGLKLQKT